MRFSWHSNATMTDDSALIDISFTSDVRGVSVLHCLISSVPQKKLRTVGDEILQALKELVSAPVDLKRMTDVLHQSRRNTLAVVQDASAVWVQQNVLAGQSVIPGRFDILSLTSFRSSQTSSTALMTVLDSRRCSVTSRSSTSSDTGALANGPTCSTSSSIVLYSITARVDRPARRYFVGRPSLILIGKPSRSLSEKREAEKVAQAAATRERLGPAGLAAHGQRLRLAEARNAEPVPTALIESFRIPSLRHLSWIKTEPARAKDISQQLGKRFRGEVQDHVSTDVAVPLVLHFERKSISLAVLRTQANILHQITLHTSSTSPSTSNRQRPTGSSRSSSPHSSSCRLRDKMDARSRRRTSSRVSIATLSGGRSARQPKASSSAVASKPRSIPLRSPG